MIEIAVRSTSNRSKFTGDDLVGPIKIFQDKKWYFHMNTNKNNPILSSVKQKLTFHLGKSLIDGGKCHRSTV